MSPMSEAKKRANKKWNDANMKERYDRVQLVLPKGRKAEIQAEAERREQSVNSFINGLIDAALSPGVPGADVPSAGISVPSMTDGPGQFPYFPDDEHVSHLEVGTPPMQDEESSPAERPEQLSMDDWVAWAHRRDSEPVETWKKRVSKSIERRTPKDELLATGIGKHMKFFSQEERDLFMGCDPESMKRYREEAQKRKWLPRPPGDLPF